MDVSRRYHVILTQSFSYAILITNLSPFLSNTYEAIFLTLLLIPFQTFYLTNTFSFFY